MGRPVRDCRWIHVLVVGCLVMFGVVVVLVVVVVVWTSSVGVVVVMVWVWVS